MAKGRGDDRKTTFAILEFKNTFSALEKILGASLPYRRTIDQEISERTGKKY